MRLLVMLVMAVLVPTGAMAEEQPAQKTGVTEAKARFSSRAPKFCPAPTTESAPGQSAWVQIVELDGCSEETCKQAKDAAVKMLTDRTRKNYGGCASYVEPFPHCMKRNCPKEKK